MLFLGLSAAEGRPNIRSNNDQRGAYAVEFLRPAWAANVVDLPF